MIVQCPQCSSRYRVNDANVPPSGGRITCPSCSHKFVVYPGGENSQEQASAPPQDPDKTSVVERPSLEQLAGAMKGDRDAPEPQEDDAPATEVMSGDALNGMFGGADPTGDGTVEMQNPYDGGGAQPDNDFEGAATEVVSGDAVGGMFENLQGQQQGQQSQQATPDPERTVESSPPDLDSWQQENQQQPQQPQRRGQQQPQQQKKAKQQSQSQQQGAGRQQSPNTPPTQPEPQSPPAQPKSSPPPAQPRSNPPQTPASGGGASASNENVHEFQPEPEPEEPTAPPAQADAGGGDAERPGEDYDGPWKLKTNFGLTYEFPDTDGLKNWLSNREELDGYQLAGEDGDFRALNEWPQIGGGASASQQMRSYDQGSESPASQSGSRQSSPPPSMGGGSAGSGASKPPSQPSSGSTQPPPSGTAQKKDSIPPGKKINPQEFRPPSQEAKWNKVLWVVFLILALVATAIGLQTFDIYDIKGLVLGETASNEAPKEPTADDKTDQGANNSEGAAVGEDEAAEAEAARKARVKEQIDQLLGDAERARDNNRLQTALDKLNRAKQLDPERPEVFEMLATVYTEMGQAEDAESAEAEAKRLREQSLSKNETGADGDEKSEN